MIEPRTRGVLDTPPSRSMTGVPSDNIASTANYSAATSRGAGCSRNSGITADVFDR
jgi:hypothetical protein